MNTRFCIDSRIACHAFVAIAALTVGTAAYAGSVTVTGAFAQYVGAVQNGGPPNATFLTFINGAMVAPSEPLPGLESSFTPADPNDPDSVAMGLGRATVDLGGVNAVEFHVARVDDQGVATDDVSNLLAFTPGPAAEVGIGDEFLLGTFTLQNGVFFAADPIHRFRFR